jgi:hypothetical protein
MPIVGNILQNRSLNRATEAQERSAAEQLAYLREQAAEDKRRYEQEQAQARTAWEAYEARRAPFRAAAAAILRDTMGLDVPPYTPQPFDPTRPTPAPRQSATLGTLAQPRSSASAPLAPPRQLTVADIYSRNF